MGGVFSLSEDPPPQALKTIDKNTTPVIARNQPWLRPGYINSPFFAPNSNYGYTPEFRVRFFGWVGNSIP